MAPERRAGRTRGKSYPIDALAVARAALREPRLDRPRPGEAGLRELKLLVDHRDDLVAERRRAQQRLRWHLHDLDPSLAVPPGALDRSVEREVLQPGSVLRAEELELRVVARAPREGGEGGAELPLAADAARPEPDAVTATASGATLLTAFASVRCGTPT